MIKEDDQGTSWPNKALSIAARALSACDRCRPGLLVSLRSHSGTDCVVVQCVAIQHHMDWIYVALVLGSISGCRTYRLVANKSYYRSYSHYRGDVDRDGCRTRACPIPPAAQARDR